MISTARTIKKRALETGVELLTFITGPDWTRHLDGGHDGGPISLELELICAL